MGLKKVYVSLSQEEYKTNRLDLLNSQAGILTLLKKLKEIENIRGEKRRAIEFVIKRYGELLVVLSTIEDYFPDAQIPGEVKKTVEKVIAPKKTVEILEDDGLDEELRQIKEKLKILNG